MRTAVVAVGLLACVAALAGLGGRATPGAQVTADEPQYLLTADALVHGEGLDIGGKPDPLSLYVPFFPGLASVRVWDWEDGDAQFLEGLAPESLDFVHSSHCLEHLVDPRQGLKAWFGAGESTS